MLDYKSIIIKRYALGLSYKELAEEFSASKANPESTTSSALLKGVRSCRIRFRKGSRIMQSMSWYTAMSQVPTDGMTVMNNPISQLSLNR